MEFIDPKLKQKHSNRLKIGYALLSLLVLLATYILVVTAMGYQIFQRGGQVIQNGIIFLDTKPLSADIYVNNKKESNKTDVRLTLPESEYEIIMKADGYKDWTKRLTLEGGKVLFINYPRLFPSDLKTSELKAYSGDGKGFFTQSPDKKWILFQAKSNSNEYEIIDTTQTNQPQQSTSIPPEIIGTTSGKIGTISVIEWTSDSKRFLIKHSLPDAPPVFSIIDRDNIANSINLNKLFNSQPTKVSLIDGKSDKVYLYFATGGLLRTGDTKNKTLGEQLFDQVLDYKTIGSSRLIYATTKNSTSGNVTVNAVNDGKVFLIGETEYDPNGAYILDAGEFKGDWFYAIGSDKAEKSVIYRNPQNFSSTDKTKTPNPLITLKAKSPLKLSFSPQKRFILLSGTNSYITYDTDTKKSYRVPLSAQLDAGTNINWIEDFIIQYTISGKLNISEFDGKNPRELVAVKSPYQGFVDGSFKRLYTLNLKNNVTYSQQTKLTVEN